jgi:hypothetical protein
MQRKTRLKPPCFSLRQHRHTTPWSFRQQDLLPPEKSWRPTDVQKGNTITLRLANRNYAPIMVSQEEPGAFRILGKAIGLTRKF